MKNKLASIVLASLFSSQAIAWTITRTDNLGDGYIEHYVRCGNGGMVIIPESKKTDTFQGGGTFHSSMQEAVDAACN